MRSLGLVAGAAAMVTVAAGCAAIDDPTARGGASPSTTTPTSVPRPWPSADPMPSPSATSAVMGPGEVAAPTVVETIATGLRSPWGLAFLPDGSALVSERDTGRIVQVGPGAVTPIGTVSDVAFGGEGGLLGLAVAETFADDPYLYAYLTSPDGNRVIRMPLREGQLGTVETVLEGIPSSRNHNGGRLAFGPDRMLYVTTGDARDSSLSQRPDSLAGKILRVTPDGQVPADNPDPGSPVWSSGHRNVQGIAWDDEGHLWASEFGDQTFDELNLIAPGADYGWPSYEGSGGAGEGFTDPVVQWPPDQASPSGIAVAERTVFMTGLRGQRLWAIPVGAGRAGSPEAFFVGELGRLRAIERAPDGSLWLVTNNTDGRGQPRAGDDRILRLAVD